MSFKILDWDSRFFNLKIASAECQNNNDVNLIYEKSSSEEIDVCYIYSNKRLADLEKSGIYFEERKTFFCESFSANNSNQLIYTELCNAMNPELLELSKICSGSSRFHQANNFLDSSCEKLYEIWLQNYLKDSKVFIAKLDNKILGFLCFDITEQLGKLVLIATHTLARKKGVAKSLIQCLHKQYIKEGVKKATVLTQGNNHSACQLYLSQGYKLESTSYLYHLWLNK